MKRLSLLLCILTALFARQARGQTSKIELYADATMSSCELVDQGTALRSIHMFQTGPMKSSGARFKAPKPACWVGATWVGDITAFVATGSSQVDWSVGYGVCLQLPVHIGQINFFATGGALPCCEIVAMQPAPFPFVYTDCEFNELPLAAGQKVVINPNESCRCQNPLAAEATTWGRVKALYR